MLQKEVLYWATKRNLKTDNIQALQTTSLHLFFRKVFKKLRFELSEDILRGISNCKPGVIEGVLAMLRTRMERVVWETQQKVDRQAAENERPEADQNSFSKQ